MSNTLTFPGFIDVHVHFRDPGMPEAETTASGLKAAAQGGIAAVVTMPNTSPACDSPEAMAYQINAANSFARTAESPESLPVLLVSACITKSRAGVELTDIEALAEAGAAFLTDDGSYVASDKIMEEAMRRAAKVGLCVSDHAMDPKVQAGGVIRNCPIARSFNLPIIPPETEIVAIKRNISLCRVTGCKLHIQHISTAEGVELVREAQKEGLSVTAEATPHHLAFSCDEIPADDANWKMAPPLGNNEDRAELRRAVKDCVLMFATDHAPHPADKKSCGFLKSANGIIGLETAIPVTWQVMVEECGMSPEAWAKAWWQMPQTILSPSALERINGLRKTVVEVGEKRVVDISKFASLSRNCPYNERQYSCWPKLG